MQKSKSRRRDIKFFSQKNDEMFIVHSERVRSYAERLEKDDNVIAYHPCKVLEGEGMSKVNPLGIRKAYLNSWEKDYQWESDFIIWFANGTRSIREIVEVDSLHKRDIEERLELSRRYWAAQGICDWKIIIFQQQIAEKGDIDCVF